MRRFVYPCPLAMASSTSCLLEWFSFTWVPLVSKIRFPEKSMSDTRSESSAPISLRNCGVTEPPFSRWSRMRILSICSRLSSTSVLNSTSREYCKAKNTNASDHVKNMISIKMRVWTLIFGFETITKSLSGNDSVAIISEFFT